MTRIIQAYRQPLATNNGHSYTALACGRPRDDGTWEGWVEFVPTNGSDVLRSPRETTQPNASDLEHWARGLSEVYLEGALGRAVTASDGIPPSRSFNQDRAGHAAPRAERPAAEPVLDPFSVYAKGESMLRRQLEALAPRHLRTILRAYGLAGERDGDVDHMTESQLVELIVASVRARSAA